MDAVLVEALAQTPEGQAFTGLSRSATSEEVRTAWESFTQVLSTDYLPQLQTAAGDDATAGNAVTALTTYTSMSARLASGESGVPAGRRGLEQRSHAAQRVHAALARRFLTGTDRSPGEPVEDVARVLQDHGKGRTTSAVILLHP